MTWRDEPGDRSPAEPEEGNGGEPRGGAPDEESALPDHSEAGDESTLPDPSEADEESALPDPSEADEPPPSPSGQDPTSIYDPGLQPERTLLSWRRTCLAFGVASLVGMRFTVDQLGLFGTIVGLAGAGLAVLAYVLAAIGYQRAQDSLLGLGQLARDGKPMLVGTAAVLCIGTVCVAFLVVNLIR